MATAIVICEDAGFFRHRGFDARAIENSIKDNLKTGRFLRGASTVSMQLAKNLYLSRDKTVARKLQEAVLTLFLEQELSKEQILEIYFNVIEYGPGLYGIGPAARHYFATTPDQLTLGQSLYLASILPNPRHQHFSSSGEVTEGWMRYLHKLMQIALKIRRVDEQQLEEALAERIVFRTPSTRPSLLPGDEIIRDEAIFGAYEVDPP
jgi:membrane peptidoglycan carboxypeptidase